MTPSLKNKVYQCVSEAKTQEAIDTLLADFPHIKKEATLLKAKYADYKKKELLNTATSETLLVLKGQIDLAILELMDTQEEKESPPQKKDMFSNVIDHQLTFIRENIKSFLRSRVALAIVIALIIAFGIVIFFVLDDLFQASLGQSILVGTIVLFLITVICFTLLLSNHIKSMKHNKSTLRLFMNLNEKE